MSSRFLCKAIWYIPLPVDAIESFKNLDSHEIDTDASFLMTIYWPISRQFLNATVPYMLSDSILDKNEMALALLADSFCYTTEASLAPDFSIEMKIDCLKRFKDNIQILSVLGDTNNEEIRKLICECRLLEKLSVEAYDEGTETTYACDTIRYVFKNHPFLRGKAAAVQALYDVLYLRSSALTVRNPLELTLEKDDFLGQLLDLIMKVGFSDMDILTNLLLGLTGAIYTSSLPRFYNRNGERQKMLDLLEPLLQMFVDVVESGDDLKRLPLSVLAAFTKVLKMMTVPFGEFDEQHTILAPFVEGMYSWRDEFWDKYRDRLIVPVLNTIPLLGSEKANEILKTTDFELRRDLCEMNMFYALFWTVRRHPRLWIDDFGFPDFSKKASVPSVTSTSASTTTTQYVPNQGSDATSRARTGVCPYNSKLMYTFSCCEEEIQAYADYLNSAAGKNKGIYDHLPLDNFAQMWNWVREEEERKKKNSLDQSRVDLETILEYRDGFVYCVKHFLEEYLTSSSKNKEVIAFECRKSVDGVTLPFPKTVHVPPTIIANKSFFKMMIQTSMHVYHPGRIATICPGVEKLLPGDVEEIEAFQKTLEKETFNFFKDKIFSRIQIFGQHACKAALWKAGGLVTILIEEQKKEQERKKRFAKEEEEEEAAAEDEQKEDDGEVSWKDDDSDEEDEEDEDEDKEEKFYKRIKLLTVFSDAFCVKLLNHCSSVISSKYKDSGFGYDNTTEDERVFLRRLKLFDLE